MKSAILVVAMSLVTMFIRFLPFIAFRKKTPAYIKYLGRVLPSAIIGMLVIYCLKDINLVKKPFGLPEIIAGICVVILQAWKRNSLISILAGTVIYMVLVQVVFGA